MSSRFLYQRSIEINQKLAEIGGEFDHYLYWPMYNWPSCGRRGRSAVRQCWAEPSTPCTRPCVAGTIRVRWRWQASWFCSAPYRCNSSAQTRRWSRSGCTSAPADSACSRAPRKTHHIVSDSLDSRAPPNPSSGLYFWNLVCVFKKPKPEWGLIKCWRGRMQCASKRTQGPCACSWANWCMQKVEKNRDVPLENHVCGKRQRGFLVTQQFYST